MRENIYIPWIRYICSLYKGGLCFA
ncbi:hypothetical protein BN13_730007 [Nostocoides jenkinsii Ben 74]|uniref:Uncharacterized protein n=1 Tax=Nostocoides jenkinsii Ben 74 TaxID=1193518 RepID=A0A077M7D9_9MICO|nr:hypothetical protein BN13_1770002 [Tetrasphaera jenkinsii Ben 74]CCI53031.1 hypothetical protein BN13_280028 [Tetrasphaera jenkinsii Ben 74]CCI54235.1 hypothetical protein BN13_650003 [Tetrasphaera jenkinsii Ben 74]CCI54477.1 hypothetical protein BN13_730007 [Tetrasphaera jenkinsii Ben 74]